MPRQKIVNRKFASRMEREIVNLIYEKRYIISDIERETGLNRAFFSRIQKGSSMALSSAEAVLNVMGYRLSIVKMEGAEEDDS